MKRLTAISICAFFAAACSQQQDYKTERDQVMKFHDVVMEDQGVVVGNQMKLDSLIKDLRKAKSIRPEIDTLKEKIQMLELKASLSHAEEQMNNWMHKFEPDVSNKSNEDAIVYFKGEKAKIARIDSLYKQEIKVSNAYLSKFKK